MVNRFPPPEKKTRLERWTRRCAWKEKCQCSSMDFTWKIYHTWLFIRIISNILDSSKIFKNKNSTKTTHSNDKPNIQHPILAYNVFRSPANKASNTLRFDMTSWNSQSAACSRILSVIWSWSLGLGSWKWTGVWHPRARRVRNSLRLLYLSAEPLPCWMLTTVAFWGTCALDGMGSRMFFEFLSRWFAKAFESAEVAPWAFFDRLYWFVLALGVRSLTLTCDGSRDWEIELDTVDVE